MTVTPGRRASTSRRSRSILLVARRRLRAQLGLQLGARPTSWPASPSGPSTGCAATSTRSSAGCRSRYFDSHPRGDTAEPRHQRHRQHRPDAPAEPDPADHLAAHDHRRADHDAARSARSWRSSRCSPCPLSIVVDGPHRQALAEAVRRPVGVDRQRSTATSRRCTPGTRSSRCSAASRRRSSTFDEENEKLYEASYRAQFISGIDPAGDELHRQPQLRRDRASSAACGSRPAR